MKFALFLYDDEATYAELEEADVAEYAALDERHGDAIVAGEGLLPTTTATTLRLRDGERLLTDGPFAETREQLGGLYIIDVADLDAALAFAAEIPAARHGSVEVRPVMELE